MTRRRRIEVADDPSARPRRAPRCTGPISRCCSSAPQPAARWPTLAARDPAAAATGGCVCLRAGVRRLVRGRVLRRGREPRDLQPSCSLRASRSARATMRRCCARFSTRLGGAAKAQGLRRCTLRRRLEAHPARSSTSTCSSDRDVEKLAGDPRADAHPAHLLQRRGAARAAPRDPRGRAGALRDALLRQSEEIRAAADRHLPRPADRARQVDLQVRLDPRHGRVLRRQPVPRRSSATTGGLDSLLEPTGNIKKAQEMAARAFGADHVFFVTNGTSTSNKMAVQALLGARRHRHRRPQLPQVAPLRHGAGRRAALYVEAFPMTEYSMYGAVPLRDDQAGAARPQGRGPAGPAQDARPDELHLRRAHVQHAPGDGGMPGDQAGPDLPVGRGLVRLRALLAVPAAAHGDGRRGRHRELAARSGLASTAYEAAAARNSATILSDEALLDTRLIPIRAR